MIAFFVLCFPLVIQKTNPLEPVILCANVALLAQPDDPRLECADGNAACLAPDGIELQWVAVIHHAFTERAYRCLAAEQMKEQPHRVPHALVMLPLNQAAFCSDPEILFPMCLIGAPPRKVADQAAALPAFRRDAAFLFGAQTSRANRQVASRG